MESMIRPSCPICGVTLRMIPSVMLSGEYVVNAAEVVLAGVTVALKNTSCRPIRMTAFWLLSVATLGAERTFRFPLTASASRKAENFDPATPIWKEVAPEARFWAAEAPPASVPERWRDDRRSGRADQLIPYFVLSSSRTSKICASMITPVRMRASIALRWRATRSTFSG